MKKFISILLIMSMLFTFGACGKAKTNANVNESGEKKKIVLATDPKYFDVANQAKEDFEREYGIELEIRRFDDYVLPNTALAEGSVDATLHQHRPYLEAYNKSHNTNLAVHKDEVIYIGKVFLISDKIKSVDELKDGDTIAVSDDMSNRTLALALLADIGLIEVKDSDNITLQDITANPKNLNIIELPSGPQFLEALKDVTAACSVGSSIVQSGRDPRECTIASATKETLQSALILAVRAEDKDSDWGTKLKKALVSEKMEEYITEKFKGSMRLNLDLR